MRKKREQIVIGSTYNFLTIISFSHKDKRFRCWYNVICECGIKKIIMGSAMVSGNTKSCGCQSSKFKKENRLLPENLGVKRQIILQYKRHAIRRNIQYKLSEQEFIFLLDKPCFYCGLPPSNIKTTKNYLSGFLYNGIDRVNSDEGYFKNNCVPCCEQCNKAKMALKKDDFLSWVERVYNHSIKKQW